MIDLMNRFPDTFQTVTDRSLFDPNVPGKMIALTKWLTNSGCVAQALSSLSHSSSVRQTIMSAMSQQLQSDLCVAGTSNPPQTRLTLPKLDILAVDADQGLSEEWEAEDDVKGGPLDPREVKIAREKEISICGTWRCTSTPPKQKHEREQDATRLASSGLIPTKEPILLGVACQEDVFQVEDPMLITIADVSRAHFYADAVREKRNNQACVGNCERRCMALWMRPNDGESITRKSWRKEDAPEAWRLRVTSSTKTWRRTFWYTAMTFSLLVDRRSVHVLRLLRSAYELSKVVTLGPGPSQSRTATILGRTLTSRQWGIEYEPDQQHVSRALKALG